MRIVGVPAQGQVGSSRAKGCLPSTTGKLSPLTARPKTAQRVCSCGERHECVRQKYNALKQQYNTLLRVIHNIVHASGLSEAAEGGHLELEPVIVELPASSQALHFQPRTQVVTRSQRKLRYGRHWQSGILSVFVASTAWVMQHKAATQLIMVA